MANEAVLAELEEVDRHVEQHKWATSYHRSQLKQAAARRADLIERLRAAGITVELKAKEQDHGQGKKQGHRGEGNR